MNSYEMSANNFLNKANCKMQIIQTGTVIGFPSERPEDRKQKHNKYRVVLTRGGKSFDFDFYGSYLDYLYGRNPSAYDVLACIEKYEYPTDPWEFSSEFGYDIECEDDYNRVRKTAEACREQYEGLLDLFGEELMTELQEIQ